MGEFGYIRKPDHAAQVRGLFNGRPHERETQDDINHFQRIRIDVLGLLTLLDAYFELDGDMFKDSRPRTVQGLDVLEMKMSLAGWIGISGDLAAKVAEYRVTLIAMAVESRAASAKAALGEVKLTPQVPSYDSRGDGGNQECKQYI